MASIISGTVSCDCEEVTVKPKAPDSKCVIVVSGNDSNFVVPLLMGETKITVKVSSVDGTKTKVRCKDNFVSFWQCSNIVPRSLNPSSLIKK